MAWPSYTDPLFTHLNYPLSSFIERERWILTRMTNAGRIYFAIEDERGALIGEISLREISTSARTSRLGIHMAPNKRGLGYGREAIEALLDHYFNDMRYDVLFLDVAAHNGRALRLYESLAFNHLQPLWRIERRTLPVFIDERFADIREHFRRHHGITECMYYDMCMTREDYLQRRRGKMRTALTGESEAT